MKISREKINQLSQLVIAALAADSKIVFKQPRNEIRLKVVEVMRKEMEREEQIEGAASQRILSMSREIPEGSEEWDVLFDKYYREESDKVRKIR
jgi:hypothetical protein